MDGTTHPRIARCACSLGWDSEVWVLIPASPPAICQLMVVGTNTMPTGPPNLECGEEENSANSAAVIQHGCWTARERYSSIIMQRGCEQYRCRRTSGDEAPGPGPSPDRQFCSVLVYSGPFFSALPCSVVLQSSLVRFICSAPDSRLGCFSSSLGSTAPSFMWKGKVHSSS